MENDVAEDTIAVDPCHELKPVKMMQALQGNSGALHRHAATILRNERQVRVENSDGILEPVIDEGGRENMKSFILDVQSTVRAFDDAAQATVERAVAQTETRFTVCPMALAIRRSPSSKSNKPEQQATSSPGTSTSAHRQVPMHLPSTHGNVSRKKR